MKIILNNFKQATTFHQALGELVDGATTLSLAVSYVKLGGWELFRACTDGLSLPRMRIICTDQLGVTQPAAVKRAIGSEVQIRNFVGNVTYHPKVFLAHDRGGQPKRFLLGSANLSESAFTSGIEAAVLGEDPGCLRTVSQWFDHLFERNSEAFTPELLHSMELKWKSAAAERARDWLKVRRRPRPTPVEPVAVTAEDVDTLEDVLATIQIPVSLLNMDYAGNNIRNIARARAVMTTPSSASPKQKSELKLLGFMEGGDLTALGKAAAAARTNDEVARLWCAWLKRTPDVELLETNARLLAAKRVLPQFWQLKKEVRTFFLDNARTPPERRLLQTLELLCNAQDIVQELSLEDMRALQELLLSNAVPQYIRDEITDYFDNKGQRGWDTDDRRIVPLAWNQV